MTSARTSTTACPMTHRILRLAAATVTAALVGCASTPADSPSTPAAAAQPSAAGTPSAPDAVSRESVRTMFARLAGDRAALERMVGARYPQLSGRKRELMIDQVAAMFGSPAFADRTFDLVEPKLRERANAPVGSQVVLQAQLREQAAALGMQLTLKGMTRLGPQDQERFARDALELHRSVDAATCRALIDGKVTAAQMQEIELRFQTSRSDAAFEQSLAMSRRAMQAELADSPPVGTLTPQQAEAAQRAWGRAILARSNAPVNKARFARYKADTSAASDADACWAALQYLEAMFDLRGNERVWQLRSYMLETAGQP